MLVSCQFRQRLVDLWEHDFRTTLLEVLDKIPIHYFFSDFFQESKIYTNEGTICISISQKLDCLISKTFSLITEIFPFWHVFLLLIQYNLWYINPQTANRDGLAPL